MRNEITLNAEVCHAEGNGLWLELATAKEIISKPLLISSPCLKGKFKVGEKVVITIKKKGVSA